MKINPVMTTKDINTLKAQIERQKINLLLKKQNASEEIDKSEEVQDVELKCLMISRRIIRGDLVPREDHNFLQEHNPELYTISILMRRNKDNPEEFDRISEDDGDQEKLIEDFTGSELSVEPSLERDAVKLDIKA